MLFGIAVERAWRSATESMCCCLSLSCWSCRGWSCGLSPVRDCRWHCFARRSAGHFDGGDASGVCCYCVGPYSWVRRPPKWSARSVDNLYRLPPTAHLRGRKGEKRRREIKKMRKNSFANLKCFPSTLL